MLSRIRNLLAAFRHQLTSGHYRMIKNSGLFDPDYYRRKNPDIDAAGFDPLTHYLTRGYKEQRRTGPLFDQTYYLQQVPELREQAVNPLVHYIEKGRYLGYRPNVLVDPSFCAAADPRLNLTETDALTHFLSSSASGPAELSPSPYFSPAFYCAHYRDAESFLNSPQAAYKHFLEIGIEEHRQPGPYFDTAYYFDKNPILEEVGIDPLSHYCRFGAAEGKSPCPLFDPDFYRETCPEADCDDLFGHYLAHQHDDRRPSPWFDPLFYRTNYLLETEPSITPLQHYLEIGLKNRHYTNRQTAQLVSKPLISVLVPVYNVKACFLNSCIRSVLYQSYPHWELCLVDDCSSDPAIKPILEKWKAFDPRIKVTALAINSGISAATNAAAELATGSYLVFLDNDDELTPTALQRFAAWLNDTPAELYYSDEDLIGEDGRRHSLFRKPDLNQELLLNHNYVTHCVLTKASLFEQIGGCDERLDGAQDHDLFLKLSEAAKTIHHIPEILYHWRASEQSTSINHRRKQYADEAGRKSVAQAMMRRHDAAEVLPTELKFFYRARRRIHNEQPVSLVVFRQDGGDTIVDWVRKTLTGSGHPLAQLIFVTPEPLDPSTAASIQAETGIDTTCRLCRPDDSPVAAFHSVLADIKGFYAVFINGELRFTSESWLAALIEYGQSDNTGIVGGRVDYPDSYYDLISPVPDFHHSSPVYYLHFVANCSVFMNGRHCQQLVRGVHSDLFLIRSELLHSHRGFNAGEYPHLFAPLDLSFGMHQNGWNNVYTPYCRAAAVLSDFDRCSTVPADQLQQEKERFQARWRELLTEADPFYNRGLIIDNGLSLDEYQSWLQR